MTAKKHLVLIHGTWSNNEVWKQVAEEFRQRGFTVHTPVLRHHELPAIEGAKYVGNISLLDYINDLCAFVSSLDAPPILVGHSLGGFLAQHVAARCQHRALVLLSPAPVPPIFGVYPWALFIFASYFLRWGFWRKPMLPPSWLVWKLAIANEQPLHIQQESLLAASADSGRSYFELIFWFLDKRRVARLDSKKIKSPVLVLGGENDRTINPRIARQTAALYARSSYAEIPSCGHMMIIGQPVSKVMQHIDRWLNEFGLAQQGAAPDPHASASLRRGVG